MRDDADVLGTGWTSISRCTLFGHPVRLKEENRNATGSFKDRGMAVLANLAPDASAVHVDSVGNTAAALAAYARARSLKAHVFAPLFTSPQRVRMLESLGGHVHLVAGPRAESGKVARAAARDALYLSHIYQPTFQIGTATCAFEIAEQLDPLPDRIFLAVGQGTLLLGLFHGFRALVASGLLTRSPALHAVRPADPATTVAVGAGSVNPVRASEVEVSVRATGGAMHRMAETEIARANDVLEDVGYEVDPAAALAVAGWRETRARDRRTEGRDLVVLCGARREPFPEIARADTA